METLEACMVCHGSRIETLDAEWHFCRCAACGYVFDSPRPTYDELVAFYSGPTKYDHWVREGNARDALWKRRLKRHLLAGAGFSLVEESIDPYYVARGPIAVIQAVYYSFHKALFALFRVNRYDTIWMIARKLEQAGIP